MKRLHLSWRHSGDALNVAVAINRLLAHGHSVWWFLSASRTAEAGDYLVEEYPGLGDRLAGLGLLVEPWTGRLPRGVRRLSTPRICLLSGKSSAYPYFAYYSLCLASLGLSYEAVGGTEIVKGGLTCANMFVLPGGFAIWGLDVSEQTRGVDAAVRAFLAGGGACIGSCGGAFYLSTGRPSWTCTAWTCPRYTHEYLQTGVGIVSLDLINHPLSFGLPQSIEVPYFHGPIYNRAGKKLRVLGVFGGLCLPGRLMIDNPLTLQRFEKEMAGHAAVLLAHGSRGRAILFSPHPEMGDLVRKYVALDGYVRRYIKVRGKRVMEETLRAYRPLDSPAFRLVLNAIHFHMAEPSKRQVNPMVDCSKTFRWNSRSLIESVGRFREAADRELSSIRMPRANGHSEIMRTLAGDLKDRLVREAEQLCTRLSSISRRSGAEVQRISEAWLQLADSGTMCLTTEDHRGRSLAERLMQVDLAICLFEAWKNLIEAELVLYPAD